VIKVAPLSSSFMLVSMLGMAFSVMFLQKYSLNWAFIIGFISVCMFIASMISMTKAPIEAELLIDEHKEVRKQRIKVSKSKRKQHE
jgi:glucose uptake protein GlcU